MNEILIAAGFGILGALVRFIIITLKAIELKKKLSASGLWLYGIVLIAVGAFSGIVLSYGSLLSFLAGYAGLDLIEGYYSVFKKKKIKFK